MTTFRLTAGRPAASPRSRPAASREDEPIRKRREWIPNREADTPLACGDSIPWPVVAAFGGEIHGQIWCSEHGWQPELTKTQIKAAKRERKNQQCPQHDTPLTVPF